MAAGSVNRKSDKPNRVLNCISSRTMEKDWTMSNALQAGVGNPSRIPPAMDLRSRWWTVSNQHDTGSCVGWALADAVLRWHMVKARKLTTKQHLSSRFIWMASKEMDEYSSYPSTFIEAEGTSIKAALDVVRKYGCILEEELPFGSNSLYKGEAQTLYATASKRKISSYFNLGTKVGDWRRWIATGGPIVARIDVDDRFAASTATTAKLDTYDSASVQGGHAIALVGYTLKGFIVRNSWGTEWGDGGFAYVSNDYALAAFTEVYGVSV